jgi:hypothetical protein
VPTSKDSHKTWRGVTLMVGRTAILLYEEHDAIYFSENTNSKHEQHTHSEIYMSIQWSDERGTRKRDYVVIPIVSVSLYAHEH